jgi:hypothetical protein
MPLLKTQRQSGDAKAREKSHGLSLPSDLGLCLFQEALTAGLTGSLLGFTKTLSKQLFAYTPFDQGWPGIYIRGHKWLNWLRRMCI